MKPGIKTTEFWMTIINAALMVAVAFGLAQEEAKSIGAIAAPLVAAILPTIAYIWSRTQVKQLSLRYE